MFKSICPFCGGRCETSGGPDGNPFNQGRKETTVCTACGRTVSGSESFRISEDDLQELLLDADIIAENKMKLRIEERYWGINHRDGGRSERITADVTFPCKVGDIPEFGNGGRYFCIDEVAKDGIVLSVHYENNPSADKKWKIKVGGKESYMPRSFDGGYKYRFFVTV